MKKAFHTIVAVFIGLAPFAETIHADIDRSPEEFFRSRPLPAESGKPLLYPKGSLLPFTFYSAGGGPRLPDGSTRDLSNQEREALWAELAEAGVPLIGPQYGLMERSLEEAPRHPFQIVYSVGLSKKAFRALDPASFPLDDVEKQLREELRPLVENKSIGAWDIRPEELRPWRKHELAYLEMAAKVIRDMDPLKRPVYHYCPGHYTAEALSSIAPHVDFLGKGMYTNYSSQKESRVWCRWTIEEEIKATSGTTAVPIALPEMFREPEANERERIPTWVRHDVYLALVSGAKGIFVFSLRQRDDFPSWRAYFDAYKQIATELFKEKQLANIFLFGEQRDDLRVEIISGPASVEIVVPSANIREPLQYPSIHWRSFAYEGKRYLIAVNSAEEPCRAMISGFPYDSVEAHPLFEELPPFGIGEGEFEVEFQPLEVKAYLFTRK